MRATQGIAPLGKQSSSLEQLLWRNVPVHRCIASGASGGRVGTAVPMQPASLVAAPASKRTENTPDPVAAGATQPLANGTFDSEPPVQPGPWNAVADHTHEPGASAQSQRQLAGPASGSTSNVPSVVFANGAMQPASIAPPARTAGPSHPGGTPGRHVPSLPHPFESGSRSTASEHATTATAGNARTSTIPRRRLRPFIGPHSVLDAETFRVQVFRTRNLRDPKQ